MSTSEYALAPPNLQIKKANSDRLSESHDLLRQVAAGNEQAFEILYAMYAPLIRSYLSKRLHDPENLDEALNDVMIVIWQKATNCPPHVALAAWLHGIARRQSLKYTSQLKRPKRIPTEFASEETEPEWRLLARDQKQALDRALAALPGHERQPLELILNHGCSYKDIASQLDVSISTIKTRVKRGRERLATALLRMSYGDRVMT